MKTLNNIQSLTIKVNGHEVRYYTGGQGEPLVIIHGGLGDAGSWLNNVQLLSRFYKVYIPDLPGFGESQLLEGVHSIPSLTVFLDNFTDSLGLKSFYLMGHSIGGGIALNYALRSPRKVKKLVLISSLCLGKEIALWVRVLSRTAKYIGSALMAVLNTARTLTPRHLVLPLSKANIDLSLNITTFKEQTLVLANRLNGLMMPTLLVWGAKDEIVPVTQAYAAANLIPHCQLKVFENRGHDVHRDEINQFSNLVYGFLS